MPITPNFFPDSTSFLSCNLISCYQMHSPCMSFWCIKVNKIKTDSPTFFLLMNPLYLRISLSFRIPRLDISVPVIPDIPEETHTKFFVFLPDQCLSHLSFPSFCHYPVAWHPSYTPCWAPTSSCPLIQLDTWSHINFPKTQFWLYHPPDQVKVKSRTFEAIHNLILTNFNLIYPWDFFLNIYCPDYVPHFPTLKPLFRMFSLHGVSFSVAQHKCQPKYQTKCHLHHEAFLLALL